MPTSQFGWSSDVAEAPIFNVFTNKKKAPQEKCSDSLEQNDMPNTFYAKRQCIDKETAASYQNVTGLEDSEQLMMEDSNHNYQESLHMNSAAQHNHNITFNSQISINAHRKPIEEQPILVPWPAMEIPQSITRQSQMCSENQDIEFNDAVMSMESDFSPDPSQYHPKSLDHSDSAADTTDTNSDFCRQYCGVGNSSPTSDRIRCYCKPSWEGMMDLKPYISDIY